MEFLVTISVMIGGDDGSVAGSVTNIHKVVADLFCRLHNRNNLGVNVFYFNARSLNGVKLDEVRYVFENSLADIICVTETWFNPGLPDTCYDIPNFKLLRNDRKLRRGGGVAIYYRNYLNANMVSISNDQGIEFLNVEFSDARFKTLISCVYRPPNHQCSLDPFFLDLADKLVDYDFYFVCGDFNINMFNYDSLVDSMREHLLTAGFNMVNNSIPTRYDKTSMPSLLDYVLVSDLSIVGKFDQASFISDHDLLYCCVNIPLARKNMARSTYTYRDYKNVNVTALHTGLSGIDWSDCWSFLTVDDKLQWFTTIVNDLFESNVPLKTVTVSNRSCPWFNNSVKSSIKTRNILRSKWKHCPTDSNWLRFIKARNDSNSLIKQAKKQYYSSMLGSVNSSRQLWKNIHKLRIYNKDTEQCTIPVESLNDHFSGSVSTFIANKCNSVHQYCTVENPFQFAAVSESDVAFHFSKITSDAVGYDCLPLKFLKLILPFILPTLTHIINHCFTTSVFPNVWKIATITPIAKKAKPALPNDFRPISILPTLAKVCERAMATQINEYLNRNQLLSTMQSGFRSGHSCTTAMLKILDDIRVPYDDNKLTLLCLLDFSKAFDTVNHTLLCDKLLYYFHFSKASTTLIADYLNNRLQRVKVGESYSSLVKVNIGVPQGSTLGPLLFSLFINDIFACCSNARMHAFADDVQLYHSGSLVHVDDLVNALNDDLCRVQTWASNNCLTLNTAKSMILPISKRRSQIDSIPPVVLGDETLAKVSIARNLGFIINSKLSCSDHINHIIPKIYNVLRILRSTAEYTPVSVRRKLVLQLIIPHFSYFSLIYSRLDVVALRKLVVVFNNVTRYVYSLRRFDHISSYSTGILGVNLLQYLELRNIIFLHKLINTGTPQYLFDNLRFAQSVRTQQLILPKFSSLITSRLFFINAVKLWNSLPLTLRLICNSSSFKKAIYNHYTTIQ